MLCLCPPPPGSVTVCLRTAGPVAQMKDTVLTTLLIPARRLASVRLFRARPGRAGTQRRPGSPGRVRQGRAWHDKRLNTGFVRVEWCGKKKKAAVHGWAGRKGGCVDDS